MNPTGHGCSGEPDPPDPPVNPPVGSQEMEEEMLRRVKDVAHQITERVRKVLGDTAPDQPALTDPTDEAPPLS